MSKNEEPVELVMIVDRSGSMATIWHDSIGGMNTFIKAQQKEAGAANLTLVLFDHEYEVAYDHVPVKNVAPIHRGMYVPRGTTALNDAIGRTLAELEQRNPKRAIICILTDGFENASREYSREQVKAKIKAAEERGWQVVYLAANQDAFAEGATMGVLRGNTVNFTADAIGTRSAYTSMSTATTNYRNHTISTSTTTTEEKA